MKIFFIILAVFFCSVANAQIPKSGTYIYSYCDIEYNKCLSKCKIKIKGNKIWIYAPPNLSGIKEGELFESGILSKHQSGKWTIIKPQKNKFAKPSNANDIFVWIDFSKKQFWAF
ncbi:MAG: hypothetical protein WAT20_06480 [Ferruginibacter sp.]|nr:hypothetical protein [Chitinophagaceae bacterium]